MRHNIPDTVLAVGGEWSASRLYDPASWGIEATEEDAQTWGDVVRRVFHELTERAGWVAVWFPATSEVIGPSEQDDLPEDHPDLAELRDAAYARVWEALCNGECDATAEGPCKAALDAAFAAHGREFFNLSQPVVTCPVCGRSWRGGHYQDAQTRVTAFDYKPV